MKKIKSAIARHERIALQFSGGRDSLALVYLMRPWWDRMTVYWCDTGSAYPETVETALKIRDMVPHFAVIQGQQPQTVEAHGYPTDILPVSSTPMGIAGVGKGVPLQDRYSCCLRSIMLPLHQRMVEDGITLIIRGQKDADRLKGPLRSGDVDGGIEYLFPLQDWSGLQVMNYLREQGVEIPRFYEMLNAAPDCMSCTAWWEEGASAYLKRHHPEQHAANQQRLLAIGQIVNEHIAAYNREIENV